MFSHVLKMFAGIRRRLKKRSCVIVHFFLPSAHSQASPSPAGVRGRPSRPPVGASPVGLGAVQGRGARRGELCPPHSERAEQLCSTPCFLHRKSRFPWGEGSVGAHAVAWLVSRVPAR